MASVLRASRILRVLGLALGVGVKRNVLNLYKFLCRNYNTGDHKDDRIWAFGFSRGAFTIRVLVGLIYHEGLVSFGSEAELNRQALVRRTAPIARRRSRPIVARRRPLPLVRSRPGSPRPADFRLERHKATTRSSFPHPNAPPHTSSMFILSASGTPSPPTACRSMSSQRPSTNGSGR